MAKILLVEDDNNLREIYEARLQAEGYEITSAKDGEEALVVAKKEHPDLIISDVMMPRISGFEMLDILRNTEGLKDVKVIMLTALGQAEDKTRADSLGADRYLVKSQVTLEDIVKTAQELLSQSTAAATPQQAPATAAPTTSMAPQTAAAPAPEPAASQKSAVTPVVAPVAVAPEPSEPKAAAPAISMPPTPATTPAPEPPQPNPEPAPPVVPPATPTPTTPPQPPTVSPSDMSEATGPQPAPTPATGAVPAAASTPSTVTPNDNTNARPANDTASGDALMADAVKDLLSATPTAQTPASQTDSPAPAEASKPATETPAEPVATPNPEPAPSTEVTPPNSAPTSETASQSASNEEADIQAQINSFVNEPTTTPTTPTPAPEPPTVVPPATPPTPTVQPEPPVVTPPPVNSAPAATQPTMSFDEAPAGSPTVAPSAQVISPQPSVAPSTEEKADDDGVTIAHKKVIQPISAPVETQPDLNALLAKEGITSLGDSDDVPSTPGVINANGMPANTQPHQPGHVIAPSAAGVAPVDPNSIAL
ncbi:MAG TPA: response regulator [Candidatus Saccharimonadales bacterium]|jgi:CheY-like chemotaxis protein|nr:response regulator [Candidatus Saccharimonadales bacterium]